MKKLIITATALLFVSFASLGQNTTLPNNSAGQDATGATNNTYIGKDNGKNSAGGSNTFVGQASGRFNRGTHNTFVGNRTGKAGSGNNGNPTGNENVFSGFEAGFENIGSENVFSGFQSGLNNLGTYNVFVGSKTGGTEGVGNSGNFNTSLGAYSGHRNTTGEGNTFIGASSGNFNLNGSNNTYLGFSAGATSIGSNNIFIGYNAGQQEQGSDKLYIENSDSPTPLIGGDFADDIVTVNGDLEVINNGGATATIGTGENIESSSNVLQFKHRYGGGSFTNGQVLSSITSLRDGTSGRGALTFSTSSDNDNDATEKMRISPDGNLGIGTTSPQVDLQVEGTIAAKRGFFNNDLTAIPANEVINHPSLLLGAGLDIANTPLFGFYDIPATGTDSPRVTFFIEDKADQRRFYLDAVEGGKTFFSLNDSTEQDEFFSIFDSGNDNTFVNLPKENSYLSLGEGPGWPGIQEHKLWVNNGSAFVEGNIITNSKIGVGVASAQIPMEYQLAVGGKIIAEEVKVQLREPDAATGILVWPDYVFSKDYELPSLKAVENHIEEKGHLKNIPSASEVEENGISLGEMNAKLLEKIEELTLYTIQQQKELEAQKSKNETLESRLEKIEAFLEKAKN